MWEGESSTSWLTNIFAIGHLTYLSPLRYFLVVLRGTYLKGVGMEILWPQMLAMAALGIGLLTMAVLRFHKALD